MPPPSLFQKDTTAIRSWYGMMRFIKLQNDMVRLPRLKNNSVDRRKYLNLQKNFNDKQDCHEWPQDLIRFDWMTTLSRR